MTSSAVAQEAVVPAVPTWNTGISTIIRQHCGSCHRPNGAGPFELIEFSDVQKRAGFIRAVVEAGLMPPWLPSDGVSIAHARGLSPEEKAQLFSWIEAGAPEGDPAIPVPSNSEQIEPSQQSGQVHTATMRAPWVVPAEGGRRWFKAERDKRTFVMPLANEQPIRVQKVRYMTSAPLAVAATALAIDTTGQAREVIDWDDEPGSYMMGDFGFTAAGTLALIGPGGGTVAFPTGYHITVPAHADVVSEVHFRPQGRAWELRDTIELEAVPEEQDSRAIVPLNLMVRKIELQAGERGTYRQTMTIPCDIELVGLAPRASRRCIELVLTAQEPDAHNANVVLRVDDWNPHYRSTLIFEEPLCLKAGTVIEGVWEFDNSAQNERNPVSPPEDISLGARCGMANMLLLAAPTDETQEDLLRRFGTSEIRKAQR